MNSTLRRLLVLPFLALASCAGQETTRTGFLSSYDKLQPTKEHSSDLIYVSPDYVPAHYTKVVIEDVAWRPAEGAPQRNADVAMELQDEFRKSLSKALAKNFTIVSAQDERGSGVLRVRGAITSTRRANWYVNAPAMLVGLPPVNPGGASVEIEVLDPGRSEVVVALATYNNGMPWNIIGNFQQFGHARRAFNLASELLLELLTPKSVKSVASTKAQALQE